jgi:hypothetical protein
VTGAYQPYRPVRRPGRRPAAKPRYRVLVHRKFAELWEALPGRVGVTSVQQFYDHVADYENSGAGRIDYQYHDSYTGGAHHDPHPVVFIRAINLSSH